MNTRLPVILMFGIALVFICLSAPAQNPEKVQLIDKPSEKRVDVMVNNALFTAYIYPETIMKPVLWPVNSVQGNRITRSFPLEIKPGERADHPHHIGIWFNYGDVNGLDFWNNSDAIPKDQAKNYGTVVHRSIDRIKTGKKGSTLAVSADWIDINRNRLLDEKTEFTFCAYPAYRIIDRSTTLTAVNGDVTFTDNKEGVYAIRVASELELPVAGAVQLTDAHGKVTKVEKPDMSKVTGNYLSSEGITGEKVWGTRGKWMQLSGKINGEDVSVVIIDHPGNPGYPTYWHARGYGLFAANPLGQKALSNGKDELNFALQKGQSVTFRYRMIIWSGLMDAGLINTFTNDFSKR